MQKGPSSTTGPALPPAAQAAQTTNKEKPPCPQGDKNPVAMAKPSHFPFLRTAQSLAAQAHPPPRRRIPAVRRTLIIQYLLILRLRMLSRQ